jgi:DNA-binding NtrC family response regulator
MESKKILVIDDERDFQILMQSFFTANGHQVFVAGTLKEGLAILDKNHPDVIFLDNNLPDGLGWESSEFIRTKYPEIDLNLISANHVPKTTTSCFRILEKPLRFEEMNKLIQT